MLQFSKNLHQQIRTDIVQKCVTITQVFQNPNCVIINSSSIRINTTQKPLKKAIKNNLNFEVKNSRFCKITGLNISIQKEDSFLLSHTGLRFYFETDKKVFEQIKKQYLPKLWFNSNFETIIKELAHNIRTIHYNQNTKQVRIYPSMQSNFLGVFGI